MAKVISFAKMIRRNWKKSTLLFGLAAYGVSSGVERYKTFQMMRAYCEEAKVFGEKIVSNSLKPKHVTVILNPEANDKKSNIQFEKFAAPLLHLAGFKVSMFQTESEKQARDLMEVMSNTDAVLIAGGDGTVHEAVTGLLRRPAKENEYLPLGIIPVGKTNTVANYLFGNKSSSHAQLMAEAAMAVVREGTVSLDVMKIEMDDEKPVYAVSSFEQGVFADVDLKVQKYWYLGALKDKCTYFVNAFKNFDPVSYSKLDYVAPCDGCSQCYVPPKSTQKAKQGGRWWSAFVPKQTSITASETHQDFSKVINEECGTTIPLESTYSNVSIFTSAGTQDKKNGILWIKTYPKDLSVTEFLVSGLSHRKSKLPASTNNCTIVNAREVKIRLQVPRQSIEFQTDSSVPQVEVSNSEMENYGVEMDMNETKAASNKDNSSQEVEISKAEDPSLEESETCYIDKEKYKMASCDITLLPKRVIVFA